MIGQGEHKGESGSQKTQGPAWHLGPRDQAAEALLRGNLHISLQSER